MLLTQDSRSNGFTLSADTTPVPDLISPATVDAIAKTSRASVCRSWLFVGPPGSGKTTAARQLVSAVGRILGQRGEVDRACRPYPDPLIRAREIAERLVAVAGERVSDETIVRTVAMRAGVSLSDARYAVEIEGSVR